MGEKKAPPSILGWPTSWTCHVCGENRPDEAISVESITVSGGAGDMTVNVRYCNDRDCLKGVARVAGEWLSSWGPKPEGADGP